MQELSGDYSKAKAENGTTKKSRKKQDCRTEISIPLSDGLAREGKLTIDETKVGRRNVIYIELNYYIG